MFPAGGIARRCPEPFIAATDVAPARAKASAVVKLDQSTTGRLSRVDSLQRQAVAQHGQRQAQLRLRQIEAAMRRCEDGTYGLCLDCDEPIDQRRLEADPAASLCIPCASARE